MKTASNQNVTCHILLLYPSLQFIWKHTMMNTECFTLALIGYTEGCLYRRHGGWPGLQDSKVSKMHLSCVYMGKFHPACRDNFVVLTVVKNS